MKLIKTQSENKIKKFLAPLAKYFICVIFLGMKLDIVKIMDRMKAQGKRKIALANCMGVNPSTVTRWFQQGYVPVENWEKLSECLGKPLISFLDERSLKIFVEGTK